LATAVVREAYQDDIAFEQRLSKYATALTNLRVEAA